MSGEGAFRPGSWRLALASVAFFLVIAAVAALAGIVYMVVLGA
jgi:hypothetical protein